MTGNIIPGLVISGTINIAGGSEPVLESVTVRSKPGQDQTVTPEEGVDGFSSVTVRRTPLTTKVITPSTQAQTYRASDDDAQGYSQVTVGAVNLQTKTVTPSSVQQVVTPDTGWDGLSSVTVDAVSSGYDFVMKGENNFVTLPNYMFYQDTNIRTFTGRSGDMGKTNISDHCFDGCTNLEAVYLPSSGNFNSDSYFDNCPKLKDVYIAVADSTSLPTISSQTNWRNIERIHVPADQLADFQGSSSFSTLLNKLVGDYVR